MRRLALAIVLACALSGATRAGEIHTTATAPAPTPSPVTVVVEVPTIDATAPQESTTVLTIILTLLSIVS
jgi:hypothetical protein